VLAVLSVGIGASRVVEIKRSWREGVTLFIAVVAEVGDKKTPAANAAKRPVMRRQAEKRNEYKAKKAEYEAEFREWKSTCQTARKDGEAEPPPPAEPTMERVYADDTTVEALVVILEDNPRGILVYKDELTGWIRGLDQYKGGRGNDRQHWLSIHTNTPVVVDRKSRQGDPVYLDHPFVTLAGSIQPAMLPELGGSIEDGLLDRFFLAYPHHSQTDLSEFEMEPDIEEGFARLYDSLCSLRMVEDVATGLYSPNVTPMSPEAKRRFKEIHDAIGRESRQAGFPTRLRGVWAKMRGYLARISLILALCRCAEGGEAEQVEEEDVENAAKIIAYFQAHTRRVYGKLGSVTREDLLAGELRALLEDHGGVWKGTATELYEELEGRGASGLPGNAEWLSKNVRSIAANTEELTVGDGYRGKERILKLGLATTVGTVGTVGESPGSANGTDGTDGKYANGGP
jgi:putative DNA primase/helicase